MSYQYSQEEISLPDYSPESGRVVNAHTVHLVEPIPDTEKAQWLDLKVGQGWQLITIDCGLAYFQRDGFKLYQVSDDAVIRIRPGQYA